MTAGCDLSDTGSGKIFSNSGNCHEASQTVSFLVTSRRYTAPILLSLFLVCAVICVYDSLVRFVFCLYLC